MRWVMVITLLIISSDVFSQVRGTTWGDSWEQVEKTIKDELEFNNRILKSIGLDKYEKTDRYVKYSVYQLTNGDTTVVGYSFLDEKLSSIHIDYRNPEISINKYQDIADLLKIKYGDPKLDNYNNETNEAIDILDDREGLIETIWFDDETGISLSMGIINNSPTLYINYNALLYLEELIKEDEKAKLNDF